MTKKFVFGAAVVALAALVMAPAASAACGSVRTASTYNSGTAASQYWQSVAGDGGNVGTLVGNVWQAGAPAAYNPNTGAVPCTGALDPLYFGNPATGIGLNLHMEQCGSGCPAPNSTLAVLAQQAINFAGGGPSSFLLATVVETPGGSVNFDYSNPSQSYTLARISKPNVVLASARVGNLIPTNITIPSHAAGLVGTSSSQSSFTGYKVVEALSVANPGNGAAAYPITLATIPASAGAPAGNTLIQVDCSGDTGTGKDAWIATQLSFENGAILSQVVSEPRRVHCAGALANPKYSTVPKKISGPAPTSH